MSDLRFQEINLDEPRMRRPIGATGTKITSGLYVYNAEDYNTKFQGAQAIATCDEMRRDPVVAAALSTIHNLITSADLWIEPGKSLIGKGGKKEPSPLDQKIADACREDFLDRHYGDGIQSIQTFSDILDHALLMDTFGFSAFCTWWTTGDSGRQVMEFEPRLQQSVIRFRIDKATRSLGFMHQRTFDPETERWGDFYIPADQLLLFTWKQEGDNFWGISALRPVFKPWDLKRRLELIDAVGLEKHAAGVDELHATEAMTPDQELKAKSLIQNVRANERGGLLTPDYLKYELHSPSAAGTGCNPSIARLNEEILLTLHCEGLLMGGTQAQGNRALGQVKQENVLIGLQAIVERLKAIFGRQAIRRWTLVNFGPQESYPQLAFEPMDKMSGTVLAEILKLGREAGVITPGQKTEDWYRGIIRAPEEDEPYRAATTPVLPGSAPNGPPNADGDPPDGTGKVAASASAAQPPANPGPHLPEPFWRAPFAHENHVAFDQMAGYLDAEPRRIWHRIVLPHRVAIIDFLARHYSEATDPQQASRVVSVPDEGKLSDDLFSALLDVYKRGRRSVIEDRARQLGGQPGQPPVTMTDSGDQDGEIDAEPSRKEIDWTKRIAEAFAGTMILGLIQEAISSGQLSRNANRSADRQERDIRAALDGLSQDVQAANLAGKVAQSFTNGRVEQGQAMADQISSVFYSAIMDSNTCEPCAALDGAELDPESYDEQVPNPECYGGDRCRCVPIFVFREQQLPEAA